MSLITQSRRKNAGFDLFELVLLIAVIGGITVLTAVYLTVKVHRRSVAAREKCIENLNMIEASKVQWAFDDPKNEAFFTNRTFMDGHFDPWAAVESNPIKTVQATWEEILPYLGGKMPQCPSGGAYTLGAVGVMPTCTIRGHVHVPPNTY